MGPITKGQLFEGLEVVRPLGAGGSSSIFLARDPLTGAEYALKVLRSDQPTMIERCRREAEAAGQIEHPHVVRVHGVATSRDGTTYLVMEYVPGPTLRTLLGAGKPLPPPRACRIARQLASALSAVHRCGIVHRDVKPENVILQICGHEERAKLIDLGLVKVRRPAAEERLTKMGVLLGTPAYMAPEQFLEPVVYPAADLYALGVVLHEMLAGTAPFSGPDVASILQQQMSSAPPPLTVGHGLDQLAAWLMEKRPRNRPARAEDVVDELDRIIARLPLGDEDPLFKAAEVEGAEWGSGEWTAPSEPHGATVPTPVMDTAPGLAPPEPPPEPMSDGVADTLAENVPVREVGASISDFLVPLIAVLAYVLAFFAY